jgi:hypothetical protein
LVGDAYTISDDQIINNGLTKVADINAPDGSLAYRIVKTRAVK